MSLGVCGSVRICVNLSIEVRSQHQVSPLIVLYFMSQGLSLNLGLANSPGHQDPGILLHCNYKQVQTSSVLHWCLPSKLRSSFF